MAVLAVADLHGFAKEAIYAIERAGINEDKSLKLVVLGDVLDRGPGAVELTDYLLDLAKDARLIPIRGNHEDLLESALSEIMRGNMWKVAHPNADHVKNGTYGTLLQLSGMSECEADKKPYLLVERVKNSRFYKELLPRMINFYETKNHIFTHGWIPCESIDFGDRERYYYNPDWRIASADEWRRARWRNGMLLCCKHGIKEPGKTIVCGHWNASYGHSVLDGRGTEFGNNADFSPYYADGILALDACTVNSHKVNCVRLED